MGAETRLGERVYVYCALPLDGTGSSLSFAIDGELPYTLEIPTGKDYRYTLDGELVEYAYDLMVFASEALPGGTHTLSMTFEPGSGALLDYVVVS